MTTAIVFVTGQDPLEGRGGGSSYVRAHARAALRAGFEPHIFCVTDHSKIVESDFGIVHRLATPFRPYGRLKVRPDVQTEQFLARWVQSLVFTPYMVMMHARVLSAGIERFLADRPGPHLIHGFYTWGLIGMSVSRKLQRQGVKAVTISSLYTTAEHEGRAKVRGFKAYQGYGKRFLYQAELWWIKHMVRRYEQRVYNESRLVLVNYESVRQLLHTQYGKGAEVRKLPYSSESAFLNESEKAEVKPEGLLPSLSQDDPLIVTVSRHDPRKGLDIFLRALAELRGAGVRFRACVLSGGPLLSAHRSLVEELGLSDMVIMPGFVRNPYPYLKHADLFVLPSLEEGSGSVALLEALQAGVAIVASKIDGIPEDVIDGESALLVQPGSVSALSQAIALALTDKELRERLARQARQTFIGKFSADAFTAALRDTYAELGVLI